MPAESSHIGELLEEVNYNSGAEVVNHLTAYMDTAKVVDGVGVVRQLLKASLTDKTDANASRDFSRAVATLAANCVKYCGEDGRGIVTEFLSTAPLTYTHDRDSLPVTGRVSM